MINILCSSLARSIKHGGFHRNTTQILGDKAIMCVCGEICTRKVEWTITPLTNPLFSLSSSIGLTKENFSGTLTCFAFLNATFCSHEVSFDK